MAKKIEKVYDKDGFYIGTRITTTYTRKRTVWTSGGSKKTYTEAEHKEGYKRLAASLRSALDTAKITGGDVRVSRRGVEVVPYKPNRKVFY
jgi:hypothetical protein